MDYPIYAHHAHVFPASVKIEGVGDGTIDALRRLMEGCGIQKSVAFAPFHDFLSPGDEEPNQWLHSQIQTDSSLIGFGVIDFQADDLRGQVDRIHQLGLRGIKIHPAFQKIKIDGEKACAVYERAQELGLFLSFHTGIHWHRISDYNMLLFDEVAYRFPKLRFSMEHLGGYCFFNEGLAVLLNNRRRGQEPRVYAGLTSVFDPNENRAWHLDDKKIHDLLWQAGDDCAVFGLDFPYNGAEKIAYAIQHVKDMDIPAESKAKILGGNLKRILALD